MRKAVFPMGFRNKGLLSRITVAMVIAFSALSLSGCLTAADEEPAEKVSVALDREFFVCEEGFPALKEVYDLRFDEVHEMAIGLTHEALSEKDVDVAMGFTTDGKIAQLGLTPLVDDRGFFPPNNPAPVVREDVLERHPNLEQVLVDTAERLDQQTMIHLNYLVDIRKREPRDVAREWLDEEGPAVGAEPVGAEPVGALKTEEPGDLPGDSPVIVGSKAATEQQILAQITIAALERAGLPVEGWERMGDTAYNRSALMEGRIHLYWDYIGGAWDYISEQEGAATSEGVSITDSGEIFRRLAGMDAERGLVWPAYAPFSSQRTLLMRGEHAEELGITTLSDLAEWLAS